MRFSLPRYLISLIDCGWHSSDNYVARDPKPMPHRCIDTGSFLVDRQFSLGHAQLWLDMSIGGLLESNLICSEPGQPISMKSFPFLQKKKIIYPFASITMWSIATRSIATWPLATRGQSQRSHQQHCHLQYVVNRNVNGMVVKWNVVKWDAPGRHE